MQVEAYDFSPISDCEITPVFSIGAVGWIFMEQEGEKRVLDSGTQWVKPDLKQTTELLLNVWPFNPMNESPGPTVIYMGQITPKPWEDWEWFMIPQKPQDRILSKSISLNF